jgi:membrane fusion protein, multidrug efflux system
MEHGMFLRTIATIVPGVFALAVAAHGYTGACSADSTSAPDSNAITRHIVDDYAEPSGGNVISALAAGEVTSIAVHNNEQVFRGQVLFRIDDRRYQLAVAVAQADLAIARHRIEAWRAVYRQYLASLTAAQDVLAYQPRVHDRQTQLLSQRVISELELDQRIAALLDAREKVLAERRAIADTLADLDNNPDLPVDQHPAVQRARAELKQAELDLSYTVVTAPEAGIVTNVDHLQVGEYVQVGSAVFSLVSNETSSRS